MRSVRARLLWSFLAIALAGAAVFAVAVRVMVPRLFDDTMGNGGMNGDGHGSGMAEMGAQHDAVVSAVNKATVVAVLAALVVATVAALWMSRREVRRLESLQRATRLLAAGDYGAQVEVPRERELAALATDVNDLAAALAATERHRASLINDVAHEMRTPLTTLGGVVEGYGDGLFTADEMAATARAELARLQRLAGDLADVSRAEEGRVTLTLADHDLAEVAGAVAARLRPRAEAAGIALAVSAAQPVAAHVDRERIEQVLTNLLDNAVAYTPSGGTVTMTVAPLTGGGSTVTVADTGRGLRPEELARVFERFYRGDPGGHARGTGIGLTIGLAIAKAHGGDLVAASEGPGKGSTFALTVP